MYVARVLYPVEVLGPGKRVGIWFCGCPRRCKGCSNPELWEFQDRYLTTPQLVYELVLQIATDHTIDGFTITGGDPMYQGEDLKELLSLLKGISDDIIVYTGYKYQELNSASFEDISVLIDGEYIEELNDNTLLRGSSNQNVYVLDETKSDKYSSYFSTESNKIQNFFTSDGVVSVGIHKPNF
ncbi:MAG: radical SAM protein [Oscillospiraceae bacterium]|nr:radical SAM protein [Oscillospiraceae bacterium]